MKLANLKLLPAKHANRTDEQVHRRQKMILRLNEQEQLVLASLRGERFSPSKLKSIKDPATGEKRTVSISKRVKQWWFNSDEGKVALCVRYGSNCLELAKGKFSIEVNDVSELTSVIQVVREAVAAGDLDVQIAHAAQSLRKGFKRSSAGK